jgi:hypothetical protein
VSGQLESTGVGSTVLPPTPPPRRPLLARAVVGLLVIGVAVGVVIWRSGGSGTSTAVPHPLPASSAVTQGPTRRPAAPTLAAVSDVLERRSTAILAHDRAGFLATIDPADPGFRRSQAAMFRNLRRVPLASWSYTLTAGAHAVPRARRRQYAAPTWAPRAAAVHYRIVGFDTQATDLPQYPTFVDRAGRWYLASLTDFAHRGEVSVTGLWDYAPVHVIRRSRVLVLGPRSRLGTMVAVADQMQAAVPRVSAVWGRDWSRQVVVQVPATQREMARITGDSDDLNQIAALTSAEVSTSPGRPAPVGDRVTINPRNWDRLGSVGARIVLTHELTHVATRADTGTQTPKWLAEGFADYIGFLHSGVPVKVVAAELAADVQSGHTPRSLPTDRDFRGANPSLSQAYQGGWLACRYVAARFGQPALVRFYRAVGTSRRATHGAVTTALRQVVGLSTAQFVARWRAYVDAQLG